MELALAQQDLDLFFDDQAERADLVRRARESHGADGASVQIPNRERDAGKRPPEQPRLLPRRLGSRTGARHFERGLVQLADALRLAGADNPAVHVGDDEVVADDCRRGRSDLLGAFLY